MGSDLKIFVVIILSFLLLLGLIIKSDQKEKMKLLINTPGCSYITTLKNKVYVLDCQGKVILKIKNEN